MKLRELKDYIENTHYGDDDEIIIRIYEKDQTIEYPLEDIVYDDEEPDIIFLTASE